ncbi:hypothetical protein GCM10025331_01720 [Actinoplanes utahensis]|nr:hypothetical protein Aut01nite_09000 [Actinoplanes utahensis]
MSDPSGQPQPPRYTPPDSSSAYPPTSEFPPVSAPPGNPQPGPPGYPPPPRLPRKSATPLVALVLAISLLLCGGVVVVGKILVDRTTEAAQDLTEPLVNPVTPALPTDAAPDWPDLPGLPTDLPTNIPGLGEGPEITVTYEVSGTGRVEILYLDKLNGTPKRVGNADLPWRITTKMKSPTLVSVVALRTGFTSGSVTCRASVNGKEVAEQTAEGEIATANCYNVFLP